MLWKYMFDIRQKGCINGYSTTHSENQHKFDAKQPAKRTNYVRNTFAPQMAKYVMHWDLLYNTYYAASPETVKSNMKDKITSVNSTNIPDTSQKCKLTLTSRSSTTSSTSFEDISDRDPAFRNLYVLTCVYLSTLKDGEKRVKLTHMPKPKDDQVLMLTNIALTNKICTYSYMPIILSRLKILMTVEPATQNLSERIHHFTNELDMISYRLRMVTLLKSCYYSLSKRLSQKRGMIRP